MKITNNIIPTVNVENSHNIKQDMGIYFARLNKILYRIINGCKPMYDGTGGEFDNCSICQSDYSVQFLDIAICILYEDGIINKETKDYIMSKLYDGHRG